MEYIRRGPPKVFLRWIKEKLADLSFIDDARNADKISAMKYVIKFMHEFCRGLDAKVRSKNKGIGIPGKHVKRFKALYLDSDDVYNADVAVSTGITKISYWVKEYNDIAYEIALEESEHNETFAYLIDDFSWGE